MSTFAELGEKISKKIGKLEKDLKSTEPDVRTTAERTLPRLKKAMQDLMQSNEEVKAVKEAKQRQTMLAKGGNIPSYEGGGGPFRTDGPRAEAEQDYYGGGITDPAMNLMMQNWANAGGVYPTAEANTEKQGFVDMGLEDPTGGEAGFDNMEFVDDDEETIIIEDPYNKYKPGGGGAGAWNNVKDAAQEAMITAPFGYDYGPTDYYEGRYNPAEELALRGITDSQSDLQTQLDQARKLAMEDTSISTTDKEMAIEKARQRNTKASQNLTGAARFGAQQMANANAKDNMMQMIGERDRQEAIMNDPKKKAGLMAGFARAQAQAAAQAAGQRFGIGQDRVGQDRYVQEHGLKTDAAMNALEMGKLSNMSKYAQMQKLMGGQQASDLDAMRRWAQAFENQSAKNVWG
jgi:hypothetical protein